MNNMQTAWLTGILLTVGVYSTAEAQQLPGSADPSRLGPPMERPTPARQSERMGIPDLRPDAVIPEEATEVTFDLNHIAITGLNVFDEETFLPLYQHQLGQEVSLKFVWQLAKAITQHYRERGYFLSRAYVPAQEIANGRVRITVVEGYVEHVDMPEGVDKHTLVQQHIDELTKQRPLLSKQLESFMIRLNDLPGVELRSFVDSRKAAPGEGVVLHVKRQEDISLEKSLTVDNSGSRFLGPYRTMLRWQDHFLPLQQTTFSMLNSVPPDELNFFSLRHRVPLYPKWNVEISGNYAAAELGSSLEASEIAVDTVGFNVALNYLPIRQRTENLTFTLALDGTNTNGDILGDLPLTRDRVRAIRGSVRYDAADRYDGISAINVGISRGLPFFGASEEGDPNLSRAEAEADFTTLEFNYTRQQFLPDDWVAIGRLSGQYASTPLFSSEEFGYGGSALGRAYDPSELTGEHGLAASLELRYQGGKRWRDIRMAPYLFYDVGRVWNDDTGIPPVSGASAGFGMRLDYDDTIHTNIGLAWPLTREIRNPVYGGDSNPRLLLRLSTEF